MFERLENNEIFTSRNKEHVSEDDGSKTNKRTGTGIFDPGTNYSEAMGVYPFGFQT